MPKTIKIYRKNNYIILVDDENNVYQEHYSNVFVRYCLTNKDHYDISLIRFGTEVKNFYDYDYADIKQENGSSFASKILWEDWYTANTGFNNAGTISTDVNANLKVGGTNVSNTNPVPVNVIMSGASILTAAVEIYKTTGLASQNVATNSLSISIQNLGNYGVYVTAANVAGIYYAGDYNNGADYGIGAVVSTPEGSPYGTPGVLYIRVSNPNNPGYPPGTASWDIYNNTGEVALVDAGVSITWDAPFDYKLPMFNFTNANAAGVFLLTVVR
jgi:hypothetical protein